MDMRVEANTRASFPKNVIRQAPLKSKISEDGKNSSMKEKRAFPRDDKARKV
jgi:hypothetical protein